MNATDYRAVYYHDDCYCYPQCLTAPLPDRETIVPIFASDESDYYPMCVVCGTIHDYVALTDYGTELEHRLHHIRQSGGIDCPLCYNELKELP